MQEEVFYKVTNEDYTEWCKHNRKWLKENRPDVLNCDHSTEKHEYFFKTKKDAWKFFEKSITEHYMRDFWFDFGWNDKYVFSTHFDEGGETHTVLEKWEGFDQDVELGWEFKDVVYHSLKELREAYPAFEGQFKRTDEYYIPSAEGNAWLYGRTVWDNDPEEEEPEEIEEEPVQEIPQNNTDLPF